MTASGARARAQSTVREETCRLLQPHLPLRWRGRTLPDEVALGEEGLGLDSVRLLEVILACEDRFGVTLVLEEVNDRAPTLGNLIALIDDAIGRTSWG